MSDDAFARHMSRLKASLSAHSADTICDFITEHTYLKGKKFSFEGHEYQKEILQDPASTIVISKGAQLGISEMSSRLALARCALIDGFSVIYTLPSATAAGAFMQSRISPVVESSPYLKELISKEVDNVSVKRFAESWLYLKGCNKDTQALSVPCDLLICDETDNSDQEVMTLFDSRLIASKYQMRVFLSTPSIPQYGISLMFEQSKRKFQMCKCNKCNHWFIPDYHEHVKVPGYDGDLDKITKAHFAKANFRWMDSYVACPKCKSKVELAESKRQWVVENPNDAFIDSGYQISPFDCTNVKPSAIVRSSVNYTRLKDFYNQRLGKSLEDRETSLALSELRDATINEMPGGIHSYVMGLDMGTTCWAVICAVLPNQTLIIVKIEAIPVHEVVSRSAALQQQYRIRMLVVDRGPLTEAVYQIQQNIRNSFAAVFVMSKGIELFHVKNVEQDNDKGVEGMRQVNIAKDACMDVVMSLVRAGSIMKVSDSMNDTWYTHMMDNKRIQMFKNGELMYTWVKTLKVDHSHMGLLYALVASRILGVSDDYGTPLPLLSSFQVRQR
jgi:hypothetical protein